MLPPPATDKPADGVPAAHPHTEFGAARVALSLSDFSPDDLDAFACVADSLRHGDSSDIQADVAMLAVKLAALPPLTRWAATVVNRYWTQPESTRLAFVVHFSWSHYPDEAVNEIVRVAAAFDWRQPPKPLPAGPAGAYRAIIDIMNLTAAGKARARQFIEVMEAAAPPPAETTTETTTETAAGLEATGDGDSFSQETGQGSEHGSGLAVFEGDGGLGTGLGDEDFAAIVAPGEEETPPAHRFAGLAVFAAGTAAAGGAGVTAAASGAPPAAAVAAAVTAAAAVGTGSLIARRRSRRGATGTAVEAISAGQAALPGPLTIPEADDTATGDTEADGTATGDTEADGTATDGPEAEPPGPAAGDVDPAAEETLLRLTA